MSAAQVEPHEKMRSKDVNKVARGEQAPRPPKQTPDVSPPPPPSTTDHIHLREVKEDKIDHEADEDNGWVFKSKTAPQDWRFLSPNQTRHCYIRYIEYHWCIKAKGEGAPECEKFARYYRSLCPSEWIEMWNEQREKGVFPGPL